MLKIYHNNRCGKSRTCLLKLTESHKDFEVIHYLDTPLSAQDIKRLLSKLQIAPIGLVRTKEAIWKSDYQGKDLSDEQIIEAMVKHPILIERPIVESADKAIIARTEEALQEVITQMN